MHRASFNSMLVDVDVEHKDISWLKPSLLVENAKKKLARLVRDDVEETKTDG